MQGMWSFRQPAALHGVLAGGALCTHGTDAAGRREEQEGGWREGCQVAADPQWPYRLAGKPPKAIPKPSWAKGAGAGPLAGTGSSTSLPRSAARAPVGAGAAPGSPGSGTCLRWSWAGPPLPSALRRPRSSAAAGGPGAAGPRRAGCCAGCARRLIPDAPPHRAWRDHPGQWLGHADVGLGGVALEEG